jgi:hypothetical protein
MDACEKGELFLLRAVAKRRGGNPFSAFYEIPYSSPEAPLFAIKVCLQNACFSKSEETIDYVVDMWGIATHGAQSCPDYSCRQRALENICSREGNAQLLQSVAERWKQRYGSVDMCPVFKNACWNGAVDAMAYLYSGLNLSVTRAAKLLRKMSMRRSGGLDWLRWMMPEAEDIAKNRRQGKLTEFYAFTSRPAKRKRDFDEVGERPKKRTRS